MKAAKTHLGWLLLLFTLACSPAVASTTNNAPPIAATAPPPAPAPPPPPAPIAVAGPGSPLEKKVASMRAELGAARAELDGHEPALAKCKLDALTVQGLTEQGNDLRAALNPDEGRLDALDDEARELGRATPNPTIPIRERDLDARLDELHEQIRRARVRARVLGETVRGCATKSRH